MTAHPISDTALLDLHAEALFRHDAAGRIVAINEPNGGPPPRFWFGRTRSVNAWRVGVSVPADIAGELHRLAAGEPVVDDVQQPPKQLDAMLAALGREREATLGHCGPAYRFPEDIPGPGDVTRITFENRHLLRTMDAYLRDVELGLDGYDPRFVVVVDDAAVAICNSARLTDRAAEAGVETLEGYRGQGYAARVVAAWARAIRDSGRLPMYSTSWENAGSQGVARKLDLVIYGSDLSVW